MNEPAAPLLLKSPSPTNPTFQQPSFSMPHGSDVNFSQAIDMSMTSFPSTFMNSAYSHETKQLSILQERTKCLEGQVMKLTVENSTLRTAFQCLAAAVGLRNIDPCQFDGTAFPQASMSSKQEDLRPTPESSPSIQFWDCEDWEKYLESPEGQTSKRGTLGYLEDKDGNPPSLKTGKAICRLLQGGASGRKFIHDLMENAYPMFRFATNGWKVDYLASTSYPAWWKVHLDENGRWKVRKVKGLKTEDDDDNDDYDDDNDSAGEVSMKQKAMQHAFKTEGPDKKFKGTTPSASSPTLPSPPPSDTHSSSSESFTKHLPPAIHEASPADSTDDKQDASLSHDSPYVEESIMQSKLDSAATTSKISINPLAALALAAHKVWEIPLPPPHDASEMPQSSPTATIATESSTRPVLEPINVTLPAATISITLDNSTVDSRSKPSKGNGKAKMHPGPTKNGRNLCAHHWRKQVQSSGLTEEFQRYFNDLTAAQQQAYDDEAAALVRNSKWDTKSICNGTLH
ncbi:hypothetical protein BKA83DRAFT_4496163 [Pisolithus microcarpus]|nr:hypothetical protein BKA83DRAFT_4496163 [Pisolithus microcarpus]